MKLILKKRQDKKLIGKGVNFFLNAKVELTEEEQELIKRYRVEKEILLEKEKKIPLTKNRVFNFAITIESLVRGQEFRCGGIGDILDYEKEVKDACGTFKTYLNIMRDFGGTEEVEY